MTEDFMGQLIDVVLGLTESLDKIVSTAAHQSVEFIRLLPRTHYCYIISSLVKSGASISRAGTSVLDTL